MSQGRIQTSSYSPFYLVYVKNACLPVEFNLAAKNDEGRERETERHEGKDSEVRRKKMKAGTMTQKGMKAGTVRQKGMKAGTVRQKGMNAGKVGQKEMKLLIKLAWRRRWMQC